LPGVSGDSPLAGILPPWNIFAPNRQRPEPQPTPAADIRDDNFFDRLFGRH
jgi:hypothetical protein